MEAATSAASVKFVPVSDIMKTVGWSQEKNLQKCYNKPVQTVLQALVFRMDEDDDNVPYVWLLF